MLQKVLAYQRSADFGQRAYLIVQTQDSLPGTWTGALSKRHDTRDEYAKAHAGRIPMLHSGYHATAATCVSRSADQVIPVQA